MNIYWNHFKTITKHKWVVFGLMAKAGYPIQGLKHDLSKYHPIEFYTSARYWSGTSSPIDKEKEKKGYSIAWQHHKGHNPHHAEYWVDNVLTIGQEPIPLLMPERYAVEMLIDWIGAGMVYNGENWTTETPLKRFYEVESKRRIHPAVLDFAEQVLIYIRETRSLAILQKEILHHLYQEAVRDWKREQKRISELGD